MRLLGVLIGVGIAIGLTVLVVGRLDSEGNATVKHVGVKVQAGGVVVPTPGGATGTGGNAVSAAQTVACATASETLRTAEDTYRVLNGRYADLATLVRSGTIRAPGQDLYGISSTDGFVTYHLVGQHGCP